MHLLIVEDDLDLGGALQRALKLEGFSSQWIRRAGDAPLILDDAMVSGVLLDLGLPDGSGFELLARWRGAAIAVPIIVITASAGLPERLAGLDSGADDFLVKPFAPAELVSRIRAVHRRYAGQSRQTWTCGDLELEPSRHEVRLSGVPIALSPREFRLLIELARLAGTVVSKAALSRRLEPLGDPLDFSAIEFHMSNLRRKIGAQRVRTIRGIGYMLVC